MREQQGCCWAAPGSCGGEQGCGAALHSFQHGLVGKVAWETPFPTGALPLPPSATVSHSLRTLAGRLGLDQLHF